MIEAIRPVSFAHDNEVAFAKALGASLERHGFAVLEDHGLDEAVIAAALADAKALFALPEPIKCHYRDPNGAGQRGYTPFGIETAKDARHADLKEFWHVGREWPSERSPLAPNLWPDEIVGFRPHFLDLYWAMERLGARILRAIASHLSLAADAFDQAITGGDSVLRLLHYPPASFDGPALRAEAHEDINAITLLLGAEEGGLEILDRDGRWLAINPPPGALVVNIGDMLARLTNDVLPSTTHRVVNPPPARRGVARYSMPFFLHFRPDFLIETLPGCVSADRPNRYPEPITAGGFLRQRLREIKLA
jgi:isopenicillin N synthase-like dioxygenase